MSRPAALEQGAPVREAYIPGSAAGWPDVQAGQPAERVELQLQLAWRLTHRRITGRQTIRKKKKEATVRNQRNRAAAIPERHYGRSVAGEDRVTTRIVLSFGECQGILVGAGEPIRRERGRSV